MKPVWRDDKLASDKPESNAVAVRAKDSLRAEGGRELFVWHIETATGKGFMPVTRFFDQILENGKVFPGDDSIAYMHAVTRGRRMFERAMKRDDLIEEASRPDLKMATQIQKSKIVRIRHKIALLKKEKIRDTTDIVSVICKEFFCNWNNITAAQALKIIAQLTKRQEELAPKKRRRAAIATLS